MKYLSRKVKAPVRRFGKWKGPRDGGRGFLSSLLGRMITE
jgi:hypothetical protein